MLKDIYQNDTMRNDTVRNDTVQKEIAMSAADDPHNKVDRDNSPDNGAFGSDKPETDKSRTSNPVSRPDIPMFSIIRRGLARRCPACGVGPVLTGYLGRLPTCPACGEDLSQISADDGPAWGTLIVVGHVLAPLMIILGRDERIPVWAAVLMLSAIMLLVVWWCLPRAKGLFIALIWRTGATGEVYFKAADVNAADDLDWRK